jgi:hypothetical protein
LATTKAHDPIKLLKSDHETVKGLFDKFDSARTPATKKKYAHEAMVELDIHADIEETIFYPAFEEWAKSQADEDILLEAEEEHHVVHLLIGELRELPDDAEHWDAKFTVLSENVRHHIDEEEKEMLPKAAKMGADKLGELGDRMYARKKELQETTAAGAQ